MCIRDSVTSIFCADILLIMRTPENIFEGAYAYLLVTFIGVPFTFFYNLLSSIIRALGDSKTPFWFLLFAAVLNIILDLFCILVLGWGVAGAAIATAVSYTHLVFSFYNLFGCFNVYVYLAKITSFCFFQRTFLAFYTFF